VLRSLERVDVWQFGRNAFVDPKHPDPGHRAGAEGSRQGVGDRRGGEHDLLILDEINVVADFGLVPVLELLDLARSRRGGWT